MRRWAVLALGAVWLVACGTATGRVDGFLREVIK
jgi:hypothetical protein